MVREQKNQHWPLKNMPEDDLRDTLKAKQPGYSFISRWTNVLLPEPDGPLKTKGCNELIAWRAREKPMLINLFNVTTNTAHGYSMCPTR